MGRMREKNAAHVARIIGPGVPLRLTESGLFSMSEKIVTNIRVKSWSIFSELGFYISDIITRRKVFQTYVEPILSYFMGSALCSVLFAKHTTKAIQKIDDLQTSYLRILAGLGRGTSKETLRQNLQFGDAKHNNHKYR